MNFSDGNLVHANNYIQDLLEILRLYQQRYSNPTTVQETSEAIALEFLIEDLPNLLNSMHLGADIIWQIVLGLRNFSQLDEAEMKLVDIHEQAAALRWH